jgi:alpha-amylase/alpha-mannosidase (GH57 family)
VLQLVFCWHFHQPDYRTDNGSFFLPWTYLHAVKDYADMAAHLEHHPNMRAVVNFVPTLLEQLDDYSTQFAAGEVRDPLLARLIDPRLEDLERAKRLALLESCFKLNLPTMLEPFPAYRRLYKLWQTAREDAEAGIDWLSGDYLADLVTWYHLAWTGESVRRAHPLVLQMMERGGHFDLARRRALFDLYGEIVAGIVPRYRALAERGQIELSSTPHSHPIAPLLIDFQAAREARPDAPLPRATHYPDGTARARAHIRASGAVHAEHFGAAPAGFWPAEGGVSEATLRLFAGEGARWVATGEGVLRHSLRQLGQDTGRKSTWLARPYHLPGDGTTCFFRDDHLSDLIGFEYKNWFSADAVRHFLHQIEDTYRDSEARHPVVSVILDGENAWEYYPYNGYYFLSDLYEALERHPALRVTTFADYLDLYPEARAELPRLVAGSWVYGDFSTWMGDAAKNRAWDLLCQAKAVYDRVLACDVLTEEERARAETQLKSCESSDWFWWFGDYNPSDSVRAFDSLYRGKLRGLYRTLRLAIPPELDEPLSQGGGPVEAGGVMRRGAET